MNLWDQCVVEVEGDFHEAGCRRIAGGLLSAANRSESVRVSPTRFYLHVSGHERPRRLNRTLLVILVTVPPKSADQQTRLLPIPLILNASPADIQPNQKPENPA